MTFYLGTHQPHWLSLVNVALFVSDRRLGKRLSLPRANVGWALDSGAFSELSMYGEFRTPAKTYVERIERYVEEIGLLQWAAPQDWMCEPFMLAKTGLTIEVHQQRTVESVRQLRDMTDMVNVIPVLQGWSRDDYLRHVDLYTANGFVLDREPVVGLGSVCRRQATSEIHGVVRSLWRLGLRLHGFGVKSQGLRQIAKCLTSADSMAWSYAARRESGPAFRECVGHRSCANCLRYALWWRAQLEVEMSREGRVVQSSFFDEAWRAYE